MYTTHEHFTQAFSIAGITFKGYSRLYNTCRNRTVTHYLAVAVWTLHTSLYNNETMYVGNNSLMGCLFEHGQPSRSNPFETN